jgi:hypothetical protein
LPVTSIPGAVRAPYFEVLHRELPLGSVVMALSLFDHASVLFVFEAQDIAPTIRSVAGNKSATASDVDPQLSAALTSAFATNAYRPSTQRVFCVVNKLDDVVVARHRVNDELSPSEVRSRSSSVTGPTTDTTAVDSALRHINAAAVKPFCSRFALPADKFFVVAAVQKASGLSPEDAAALLSRTASVWDVVRRHVTA